MFSFPRSSPVHPHQAASVNPHVDSSLQRGPPRLRFLVPRFGKQNLRIRTPPGASIMPASSGELTAARAFPCPGEPPGRVFL